MSEPFVLTEKEFISNFRLSRELFSNLFERVAPLMQSTQRRTRIRPELRLLVAIAFFASGSYQRMVGENLHLGMSQTAVSLCLDEVVKILNTRELVQEFIRFPFNAERRDFIARRFYELHGFPGVIGCIDGTHVSIIRPHQQEEAYFNRKHYHSLNVLIICDADINVMHVDASFGGASHDSHVWNSCPIKRFVEELAEQGQYGWLLGDSGYAQRPTMMTPILGAAPNSPEEYFTQIHCSARNTVERCIGVIKSRWRCLLAHRTLHYDPLKAALITNSCIVLHNICNRARLSVPDLPDEDRRRDAELQIHIPAPHEAPRTTGREEIVRRLWSNRH